MEEINTPIRSRMPATKFLVFVLLVVFWSQSVKSKESPTEDDKEIFIDNQISKELFGKLANKQRNIKDVWNNVKKRIVKAWEALKNFANNSKQKIKIWLQNVKARAQKVIESFKKRMNKLKEEIYEVIKHAFEEKKIVKACLNEEKGAIDKITLNLIRDLTLCISKNLNNISLLNCDTIPLNDTYFYEDLENKFKVCEQDVDNAEECLNQIRKDFLDGIELMETDIYEYRASSRGVADDLLETLAACSVDVLIESSSVIISETLQIVRCILKGSKG